MWKVLRTLRPIPRPTARQDGRVAILVLLGATLLGLGGVSIAEPYRPADGTEVLEQLPGGRVGETLRHLRGLRAELAQRPEDVKLAAEVARSFIELSRAEGDPRYAGYARAALTPWWHDAEPPDEVLFLRATLRQSGHRFDAALADLDLLLRRRPRDARAWLTRATILQVRGEPEAALESCRPLARLAETLVATACVAGARSLGGAASASYDLLAGALEHGAEASVETVPGLRAWVLTGLAEIAVRLGREHTAETHFRDALDVVSDAASQDPYLLAAFADLLLDQDRPREVIRLLDGHERVDTLLLRLAEAGQRVGSADFAAHASDLEARFAAAQRRGDTTHLGDEARFRLRVQGRAEDALGLALENWQAQREPRDARYVLESALAAKRPDTAVPVLLWMHETGLESVRLDDLADALRQPARSEVAP